MMKRPIIVATLLALGAVSAAGAQQPDEAAARIQAAQARVAAAGIPVSLIQSKVEEGRAKGVPMARIAAAVEQRAAALTRANSAMSRDVSDLTTQDLAIGAEALQGGVSEPVLAEIARSAGKERRVVAIAALTQLVKAGEVPEHALAQVRDALEKGPEALANLPAQAQAARARRGPPEGRGGRPEGAGRGQGGPPSGVPAAGGKPDGVGGGPPSDKPGGKPGGTPGGKPGGQPGGQ